jgi:hypothetical protein
MRRILTGAAIALLFVAVVHAQSKITGKWQGETKGGSQIVLDVKATATALTGTLTVDGEPNAISEGKVSKNRFTFKARSEDFTGELAQDQLSVWMDKRGPSSAAVLKRAKK